MLHSNNRLIGCSVGDLNRREFTNFALSEKYELRRYFATDVTRASRAMGTPKKRGHISPKAKAKLNSHKSVPNFSRLHKEWSSKFEKGKACTKKPCTVTQEFGLTRSGTQFQSVQSSECKTPSKTQGSRSNRKTPRESKAKKKPTKTGTKCQEEVNFEQHEEALLSILNNTGVTSTSQTPSLTDAKSRPTDARMSYYRVPKAPKQESEVLSSTTPASKLFIKPHCQTEAAVRIASRLHKDSPKNQEVRFVTDEGALSSILDNTGIKMQSHNPSLSDAKRRPTDARMSYYRVPKAPKQGMLENTPTSKRASKLQCQTEGAVRVASRLNMDSPKKQEPKFMSDENALSSILDSTGVTLQPQTPSLLGVRSRLTDARMSCYRVPKAPKQETNSAPSSAVTPDISDGKTSATSSFKAERIPSCKPFASLPRENLTQSAIRSARRTNLCIRILASQNDEDSSSPASSLTPDVIVSKKAKGVEGTDNVTHDKENIQTTSENVHDMNIEEIDAEEKRLEERLQHLREIRLRKLNSNDASCIETRPLTPKRRRNETDGAVKKRGKIALKDLESEIRNLSPLRALSPNVKLDDQRSPRSPKLLPLSPKLSLFTSPSGFSPKHSQVIRAFEGAPGSRENALCFSEIDKENISPLVSADLAFSPKIMKSRKVSSSNTSDARFAEPLLEIESLENQILKAGKLSESLGKGDLLKELDKIKKRQKKLFAEFQKIQNVQATLQKKQVDEKNTSDAMTSPLALPISHSSSSDWTASGGESDKENEDPDQCQQQKPCQHVNTKTSESQGVNVLQDITEQFIHISSAEEENSDMFIEVTEELLPSPRPVPVFYSSNSNNPDGNAPESSVSPVLLSPMRGSAQILGTSSEHLLRVFPGVISPQFKGNKSQEALSSSLSPQEEENSVSSLSPSSGQTSSNFTESPKSPILQKVRSMQEKSPLFIRSPGDLSLFGNLQPVVSPFRRPGLTPRRLLQQRQSELAAMEIYQECLLDQEVAIFSNQGNFRLASGLSPVMERCRDPVASLLNNQDAMYFHPIESLSNAISPIAGRALSLICGSQAA